MEMSIYTYIELYNYQVNEEDHSRLIANRRDLDRHLGPYPFDVFSKWTALSDKITKDLIEKIQPPDGLVFSVSSIDAFYFFFCFPFC